MNGTGDGASAPLVEVVDLYKRFASGGGFVDAVAGVSFTIGAGETLGLVGESGSGKTTVGQCVVRLQMPTRGTIRFDGVDITRLGERAFRPHRRQMGVVFQDPYEALNPRMRVWQIVDEPLLLQTDMNPAERRARVKELLRTVQLDPELFAGRFPHELSGGQQQRVGVARAIATHPRVLVLDEPTSALDASVRGQIIALLRRLQHELGLSYLFISHDLRTVRSICGRVAVMHLGRLVEVGPTDQIFRSPRHEYTQSLLRSRLSLVPGERRRLRQADE